LAIPGKEQAVDSVLIIGAGAAGAVVAKKCAMNRDVFPRIHLASRRLESCKKVQAAAQTEIDISELDADDVGATIACIRGVKPDLVINMALPYQDLSIMDACLAAGVHYMDTANYEPREVAKFEYSWQWAYHDRYRAQGLMAVLGCGFDPGVTNVFCAHAQEWLFDAIHTIDIIDCNAGSHGKKFATNFNPEINLREVTQRGRYWKDGKWIEIDPLSVSAMIDYPEVGPVKSYLIYHEEEESLVRNIKGLRQIRFWMTFSDNYIKHLEVLSNVDMTRIDPVDYKGTPVIPMEFLKCLLPEPASLAETRRCIIWNVCDHAATYREVGAQAVSYTTGVPPVVGAMMIFRGAWKGRGVFNVEELPPGPFLEELGPQGLPWHVRDLAASEQSELFAVET
jgi:saccharopine dehydrogenase (NAD+, L-lysine-forming)